MNHQRARCGAVLALAALIVLSPVAGCWSTAGRMPDVMVVVLDTVRADALELYGSKRPTSPEIARIGAESVVFDAAFSTSSWTAPATASLFTGQTPMRHGVTLGFRARREGVALAKSISLMRLPADLPTLPERFRKLGYATFGVGTNPNIGPEIGFDRGFDRFIRLRRSGSTQTLKVVRKWQDEIRAARPAFVYLHLNDAHHPYEQRAPWFRKGATPRETLRAAYESEIRHMDSELASILEVVDPEREAVLVITADHGEEFWEHGAQGHPFSLHSELNRIPLLFRVPGIVPARSSFVVSLVDVLPTLLDLVGAPLPETGPIEGRSLRALIEGTVPTLEARPALAHRQHGFVPTRSLFSIVDGNWRLVSDGETAALFDRSRDPGELRDVSAIHPPIARELKAQIDAWRSSDIRTAVSEVPLDDDDLDELRSLGYVESPKLAR